MVTSTPAADTQNNTLVHSLFDFPLRLYADLIEKPASLHIEYVLVHRYPPRAGFGGGEL